MQRENTLAMSQQSSQDQLSARYGDGERNATTRVSFVCQKCFHPLQVDNSFITIDQKAYQELNAPLVSNPDGEEDGAVESPEAINLNVQEERHVVRRTVLPPAHLDRNVSADSQNDFTLIGESEPASDENISVRLKVTSHMFDFLSGQSEVDHPLCEECTDNLLDQLDQQLKITEDEGKDYRDFYEKLVNSEESLDEATIDAQLAEMQAEEETLKQQLLSIESERAQLKEQTQTEKDKIKKLDEDEQSYYKEYNEFKRQLLEYEDAQRSVDNQVRYAKAQLETLKKTNVFNATFHIWHRGHFGTINNFRLGRLPNVPVDWNEINAAWGQTVLLLHSMANKINLTFERYRLVPYGNHSYLESLSDKAKELPLYASGGIRFFWDTKFDQAMVAFLDCLQQFKEAVEKDDTKTNFYLPYKMEKGRITDTNTGTSYSVKIQFNSEEQWTKALKFMLTNLKWGLAWVSSQFVRD